MDSIDLGKQKAVRYFLSIILSAIAYGIAILSTIGLVHNVLPQNGLTIWCEVLSPVFFWFNLLFVIIWIKQRKLLSIQLFANLGPTLVALPFLFNIPLQGVSDDHTNNQIKVISYNVRSFNYYSKKMPPSTTDVAEWFLKEDPDIICLQEYSYFEKNQRENLLDLLEGKYPFRVEQTEENRAVSTGNIILSKHKMINNANCFAKSFDDYLLWADVQIGDNVIRVLNVHLKTTELNQSKVKVKQSMALSSDRSVHHSSISMAQTFTGNARIRNQQAETIKQFMDLSPNAVLACGDFNATEFSYSYRKMAEGLKSAFRESAMGYSYTYKPLFMMLRIDHILFSEEFEGISYQSPSLPYSDHDPVVGVVKLPSK